MKTMLVACLLLVIGAATLSVWAFCAATRIETAVFRNSEPDPRALVMRLLDHPDAYVFIRTHRSDLASSLEIVRFLESDGVGLAFSRARAAGRNLQWCQFMHKTDSGWEWLHLLTEYSKESPFVGRWAKRNQEWTKEMTKQVREWEAQSDGFW